MPQRRRRAVRFVTAQLDRFSGNRCRARVILERPGHDLYIGTAERPSAGDDLWCVAEAAAAALRQVVTPDDPEALHIQGVERFEAFGSDGVLVAVAARRDHEARRLTGVCHIDGDAARAAALAVLHATNRFFRAREPTRKAVGTRVSKAKPKARPWAFSLKEAAAIRKSVLTGGGRSTCPRCGVDLVLRARAAGQGSLMTVWELCCESCHRSLVLAGFPIEGPPPDPPAESGGTA